MIRMNKAVGAGVQVAFQRFLDQGNFPEVQWQRRLVFNYNTLEYLKLWGRMAHLVDEALKGRGYHLGCYELRRSDKFQQEARQIIRGITAQDILDCQAMFGVPGD